MCYNLAPGRKSGWFYRSFSLNILGLWLVGLNHTTREHPALRKMMSTTVSKSQIWCVLQYSDASILFPIIVRIERLSATAEYTTMNALTNIASKQILLRRGHVQIPRNFLIHIPDFDVWRESGAPNLEVTICLTSERLVLDCKYWRSDRVLLINAQDDRLAFWINIQGWWSVWRFSTPRLQERLLRNIFAIRFFHNTSKTTSCWLLPSAKWLLTDLGSIRFEHSMIKNHNSSWALCLFYTSHTRVCTGKPNQVDCGS